MLFLCIFCVALLIVLFVLCVAYLTVFLNCLVKQLAIFLGVVIILLLNVIEGLSVGGGGGVNCFVVHGCAVSRKYIHVCNSDVLSVVNMYLDHLKFYVVCIIGRRYVCCSECYVVYNECDEPTSCLV